MHRPCMMDMGEADRGVTTHLQDEFEHGTKKMPSSRGNWKKPQDEAGRNTSTGLKKRTASIIGSTIICMMFFHGSRTVVALGQVEDTIQTRRRSNSMWGRCNVL